jgi:hypothetical protein
MSTTVQLTAEHEHDFWARVDRKSNEGGCWEWTGFCDKRGYPWLRINGELIGAHRIAWVLHHNQPLPSYQQVRRRCGNTSCVRPTHSLKKPKSYAEYAKRASKPTFVILKPPIAGKSEAPNRETIEALSGSFQELQQLRHVLHTLTGAIPESARNVQKSLAILHTSNDSVAAGLKQLREQMNLWQSDVNERLARIEHALGPTKEKPEPAPGQLTVEPAKPDPGPSQPEASQPRAEPTEPLSKPNGRKPKGMTAVLMSAFQAELGVPENPADDDYESLDMVFDIALGEVQEPSAAVERFGTWLSSFRALTRAHPTTEPTPQSFAREVAARRLDG